MPVLGIHPKGCLKRDNIQFTVNNYDPDEREARENGKFQYLTGLVYKAYDRDKHFKDLDSVQYPQIFVYQFVLDPHDRRPPAAGWIRIDQWNRKRVIREWPSPKNKCYQGRMWNQISSADPYVIKDFVRMWCEIEQDLGIPLDRMQAIIDPNFGRKPKSVTGLMIFEEYEKEFREQKRPRAFVTDPVDDLATGHKAVKNLLKPTSDKDWLLLISKDCPNVDWSFSHYSYEDWKGKQAEGRDLSIRVKEEGKDFVDLIRYVSVVPYQWFPVPRHT